MLKDQFALLHQRTRDDDLEFAFTSSSWTNSIKDCQICKVNSDNGAEAFAEIHRVIDSVFIRLIVTLPCKLDKIA